MTIHNVRIFRVSPYSMRQNSTKAAQLSHENVGCLSDFGCGVLMSSVWNSAGTAFSKYWTPTHHNQKRRSCLHFYFSGFYCVVCLLLCRLKKPGLRPTQKTRTLCNVILNKRSLESFFCLDHLLER